MVNNIVAPMADAVCGPLCSVQIAFIHCKVLLTMTFDHFTSKACHCYVT